MSSNEGLAKQVVFDVLIHLQQNFIRLSRTPIKNIQKKSKEKKVKILLIALFPIIENQTFLILLFACSCLVSCGNMRTRNDKKFLKYGDYMSGLELQMGPEYKCLGEPNHFSKVFSSCFQTEFVNLSKKNVILSQI
jgi:hypothetical protein